MPPCQGSPQLRQIGTRRRTPTHTMVSVYVPTCLLRHQPATLAVLRRLVFLQGLGIRPLPSLTLVHPAVLLGVQPLPSLHTMGN